MRRFGCATSNAARALTLAAVLVTGCSRAGFAAHAAAANFAQLFRSPAKVEHKIHRPFRPDAHLAILWVGHATVLVQIDDKLVMTDPVFTTTVGQLSPRLVEPGLDVADVPRLDAVLISHMHFDHLSQGSLELLAPRIAHLALPERGLVYMPDSSVDAVELRTFRTVTWDGLSVTAVPVDHVGFRYGADDAWMKRSFTGYVIEYHGKVVYFGGDTAYAPDLFAAARNRFPRIDLALLPIAPVHPRGFMRRFHMDPDEALRAMHDLGAERMMPIHYGTFINSLDAPGEPEALLRTAMARRGFTDRQVMMLRIGEQRVLE